MFGGHIRVECVAIYSSANDRRCRVVPVWGRPARLGIDDAALGSHFDGWDRNHLLKILSLVSLESSLIFRFIELFHNYPNLSRVTRMSHLSQRSSAACGVVSELGNWLRNETSKGDFGLIWNDLLWWERWRLRRKERGRRDGTVSDGWESAGEEKSVGLWEAKKLWQIFRFAKENCLCKICVYDGWLQTTQFFSKLLSILSNKICIFTAEWITSNAETVQPICRGINSDFVMGRPLRKCFRIQNFFSSPSSYFVNRDFQRGLYSTNLNWN